MTQEFDTSDLRVIQKKAKTALKNSKGWVSFTPSEGASYWVTFETFKQLTKRGMLR